MRHTATITVAVISPEGMTAAKFMEQILEAEHLLNKHTLVRFHFEAPEGIERDLDQMAAEEIEAALESRDKRLRK